MVRPCGLRSYKELSLGGQKSHKEGQESNKKTVRTWVPFDVLALIGRPTLGRQDDLHRALFGGRLATLLTRPKTCYLKISLASLDHKSGNAVLLAVKLNVSNFQQDWLNLDQYHPMILERKNRPQVLRWRLVPSKSATELRWNFIFDLVWSSRNSLAENFSLNCYPGVSSKKDFLGLHTLQIDFL